MTEAIARDRRLEHHEARGALQRLHRLQLALTGVRTDDGRRPNERGHEMGALMRRAIVVVFLASVMLVGLYFYGSPEYRKLKKECVETGMDQSDAPSDDDLHRLWMACRKIGFGAPL
jgi:hypothetical protein